MRLSGSAGNDFSRDRLDYLAKERAALDAEFEPWEEYQIAEFALSAERQPRNERELFQPALARLDDLKIDIGDGDESEAASLLNLSEETQIRTTFANRPRKTSRSRYTIGSGEELADATRTDIRLNSPQVSAPVPVELKIADKWTYSQLCERLENQLIGQYMRVSQCGILLIVHNGRRPSWSNSDTKKRLTFSELVPALRDVGYELAEKYSNVSDIEVIGIDLTARNVRNANASQKTMP